MDNGQILLFVPIKKKNKIFFFHSPFSSEVHHHINEESSIDVVETLMQIRCTCSSDSVWLVSDLRDDERDDVDGDISMKGDTLEADLFEKSKVLKHCCIFMSRRSEG